MLATYTLRDQFTSCATAILACFIGLHHPPFPSSPITWLSQENENRVNDDKT